MTDHRRIFDLESHAHFVTFSCHGRRHFLDPDAAKRIVLGTLAHRLRLQNAHCLGFVVMPEHVHAMVWFPVPDQLSLFMNKWKDQSSARIKDLYRHQFPHYWELLTSTEHIWQEGYYDFNVETSPKIEQKLEYMHVNPVRRGLVERAVDWAWSSARWYVQGRSVGVPVSIPGGLT